MEDLTFAYQPLPIRIVFGAGKFGDLADEVDRADGRRVLVLCTPTKSGLADRVDTALRAAAVGRFDQCRPHVPMTTANAAQAAAEEVAADVVVCIGGGSTIGHGKAIALTRPVKLIHVVTTYSGSEMTAVQGFTEDGVKRHTSDPRMTATTVIYDPELTLALPAGVSGPSGINAMAHSVEALYSITGSPITSMLALAGIRAMATGLPRVVTAPDDLTGRGQALYGAYLCGASLSAGMALHHKVAHVLGGSFGLPHAMAHTIALPHTLAYNSPAIGDIPAKIGGALGAESAAAGIFDLGERLGIDMRGTSLGLRTDDLDRATDLVLNQPVGNPRPLEQAPLRAMFEDILHGRRPDA